MLNIQHEEEKDNEEYRLFGTASNSPSPSNNADSDEDEMDDDSGRFFFKPLFKIEALNFFI